MRRHLVSFFAMLLLCTCLLSTIVIPVTAAPGKKEIQRDIAIVFDNSGSMYTNNNSAWCRATYAMEVFASMLNDGDRLSIYPMHAIEVNGQSFDMNHPFSITGPTRASEIRNIYTPSPGGTPIETITAAYQKLRGASGEKWLIVLTDGDQFHQNGTDLKKKTVDELNKLFDNYGKEMNILYLGIGQKAVEPKSSNFGAYKVSVEKAVDSAEVLSKLTRMCNLIFGRDTIPASHLKNGQLKIDISMKKMIVFVQGENLSNLSIKNASGKSVGTLKSSVTTRYSEKGGGNYPGAIDTKLQGMMVTYTDCPIGDYTIEYSGTASSVEVYYEPDVEMSFTFTDSEGQKVDPQHLYEGDYNIEYGMMDGKTGEFTNSDLLGQTQYDGQYSINGKSYPIQSNQKSGSTKVTLNAGDSFNADMTVRYLSGYEIHKDGGEFGWPLVVIPRQAAKFEFRISGGEGDYELSNLEIGTPYRAELYYDGNKLTGAELQKAQIHWDPEKSGAVLKLEFRDDHYDITLAYKDPAHPDTTPVGSFTVPLDAKYTAKGSEETVAFANLSYSIQDQQSSVQVKLNTPQSYYVIKDLEKGDPVRAEITKDGRKLTPEEFANVEFSASCDGLELQKEALPGESAYLIYLKPSAKTPQSGDYKISCNVNAKDDLGRPISASDKTSVKLGTMSRWIKFLIILLIIALLFILLMIILHIKALPKKLNIRKRDSNMTFDGEDDTPNTPFEGAIDKKSLGVFAKRNGSKMGLTMSVKPAKGSYLKTPQAKRVGEVDGKSVKVIGSAVIREASIGQVRYVYDEEKRVLTRTPPSEKPFKVKQGTPVMFSGDLRSNGEWKSFSVRTKLNFKKK